MPEQGNPNTTQGAQSETPVLRDDDDGVVVAPSVARLLATAIYTGFAVLCVTLLLSWMYFIAEVTLADKIDLPRLYTAFSMTVAIGCIGLWGFAQTGYMTLDADVEKRIWGAVIAATISGLLGSVGTGVIGDKLNRRTAQRDAQTTRSDAAAPSPTSH